MYAVALTCDFIAQHFLIGGDWGKENERHSHPYVLEIRLEGHTLDEHGYLVDIVAIDLALEAIRERYADALLNDLPEFAGLNPSLEHFSRILAERLDAAIQAPNVSVLTVRLWESERAWASYRRQR